MSFLGPTALKQINSAIQQGRGAAASVLGQTYNVFRLGATTTNSVVFGTPAISGFQARIRRTTAKVAVENAFFELLVYTALCNNAPLELQDVLVETGYQNDGGVYTFAQARPTRETLWVRTELNCAITRPTPEGGAAAQMPASGAILASGYGGIPKANEDILTLTDGFYGFAASGTPASVYCGLQPLNRVKDGNSLGTPTDLYREHFLCYIPNLPGVLLSELDRINAPTMDRYEVVLVYSSDLTGLSGNICIVEKLGV